LNKEYTSLELAPRTLKALHFKCELFGIEQKIELLLLLLN